MQNRQLRQISLVFKMSKNKKYQRIKKKAQINFQKKSIKRFIY